MNNNADITLLYWLRKLHIRKLLRAQSCTRVKTIFTQSVLKIVFQIPTIVLISAGTDVLSGEVYMKGFRRIKNSLLF